MYGSELQPPFAEADGPGGFGLRSFALVRGVSRIIVDQSSGASPATNEPSLSVDHMNLLVGKIRGAGLLPHKLGSPTIAMHPPFFSFGISVIFCTVSLVCLSRMSLSFLLPA